MVITEEGYPLLDGIRGDSEGMAGPTWLLMLMDSVSRHELKFSFTTFSLARPQYPNVCSNIILDVSVKILFRWDFYISKL